MSKILKKSLIVLVLLFSISSTNICCNADYKALVEQLDEPYNCCITIKNADTKKFLIKRVALPLAEIIGFLLEVNANEISIPDQKEKPSLDPHVQEMKKKSYLISNIYKLDIKNFINDIRTYKISILRYCK